MKKVILLLSFVLLLASELFSQSYIGIVYGPEDHAIGGNIMSKNMLVGYEHGVYRNSSDFSIDHDKYRLGFYSVKSETYKGRPIETITSFALCYNDYHVNYDTKDRDVPIISMEVGVMGTITKRLMAGFVIDPMQRTGSFTVGIKLGKNK